MTAGQVRVLHCLYDVAGNAGALARAERSLGLDSVAVVLRPQAFRFASYEELTEPSAGLLRQEWQRWRLMVRALRSFDVVHFNFGRSIMPPWKGWGTAAASGAPGWAAPVMDVYLRALWLRDLPLFRAAGKATFVTFQGDDARQGDYLAGHFDVSPAGHVGPGYYTSKSDATKRKAISTFDRWVDGIFALNPDLLHVLPSRATFLPYANVDPTALAPAKTGATGRPPMVVHAPTHRGVKGTDLVLAAVERLRDEGVPFEFELVEGLTHAEATARYSKADLLIDQLLVGWYGGLAVEFMALGKPVVCYIRDEDLRFVPGPMRADLPMINATPTTLVDVLRDWLTRRVAELPERGRRSRSFVERWHDPVAIARGLRSEYEGSLERIRSGRHRATEG